MGKDSGELCASVDRPDDSLCQQLLGAGLSLDEVEEMLIQYAVAQAGGNLASAARTLGMTRPQLSYRLKKRLGEAADRERA